MDLFDAPSLLSEVSGVCPFLRRPWLTAIGTLWLRLGERFGQACCLDNLYTYNYKKETIIYVFFVRSLF